MVARKHHFQRLVGLVAILVGLGLGASACGGSSSGGATQPPDTIVIKNFAFEPPSLTVAPGAKITVHNDDSSTHTLTADDGRFNTGIIPPGQTATIQVSSVGTFPYHCNIHQFMHGSLVVKA